MPPDVDPARLHVPPAYTPEFVSLIRRLLEQSHEARYLPLAVERMQFGMDADDKLSRFRAAAGFGDNFAALLKAFVARTFKIPAALSTNVHPDLISAYGSAGKKTSAPAPPSSGSKGGQRSRGHSKWVPWERKGKDVKATAPKADPKPAVPGTDAAGASAGTGVSTPNQRDLLAGVVTPEKK